MNGIYNSTNFLFCDLTSCKTSSSSRISFNVQSFVTKERRRREDYQLLTMRGLNRMQLLTINKIILKRQQEYIHVHTHTHTLTHCV